MSHPDSPDALTAMIRSFMANVRRYVAQDGPDQPLDRVLAATCAGIAAVMLAWPRGHKIPRFIALIITVAQHAWARRSWLDPEELL